MVPQVIHASTDIGWDVPYVKPRLGVIFIGEADQGEFVPARQWLGTGLRLLSSQLTLASQA
jgi:hypothetical protein